MRWSIRHDRFHLLIIHATVHYLKIMDRRMEKEGAAPYKIAEAFKMVSEQFGIKLPDDFVKVPDYEQMKLSDIM